MRRRGRVLFVICLLKILSFIMEMLGRLLVFNWRPPPVGCVIKDVHYGTDDWRKQTLDVVVPPGPPPYPVLVYIHGGAYHFMDRKDYRRVCRCFANAGYLVFNVNYGLAPRYSFPDQFTHIGKAITWAHSRAAAYGGDSTRIFLAGDSAGAYFSSAIGAAIKKPELLEPLGIEESIPAGDLKGLLLFYGGYDLVTVLDTGFPLIRLYSEGFFGRDFLADGDLLEAGSPARHVGSDYPATFLSSGEVDSLHSESVAFEAILAKAGVPHAAQFFSRRKYPEAHHGYLSVPFLRPSRLAIEAALEFLAEWSGEGRGCPSPTDRSPRTTPPGPPPVSS